MGEGGADGEEGTVRGRAGMGLGADRDWKVRAGGVCEGCVLAGGGVPVGPLFGHGGSTHTALPRLFWHRLPSQADGKMTIETPSSTRRTPGRVGALALKARIRVDETQQLPRLNRVPRREDAVDGYSSPDTQTDPSPSPAPLPPREKQPPSPASWGASPRHGSSGSWGRRAARTRTLSAHTQTPTQTGRQAPARTRTGDTQALPRRFPTKAGARAGTRSHARAHLRSPPPTGTPRPRIRTPDSPPGLHLSAPSPVG